MLPNFCAAFSFLFIYFFFFTPIKVSKDISSFDFTGNLDQIAYSDHSKPLLQSLIVVTDYEFATWSAGGGDAAGGFDMYRSGQIVGQKWSCRHLFLAFKQPICGHPCLSLSHVFSCLKWMLTAVSTHSQTASSKSSGAFFHRNVCSKQKSRSLHPWGAPSVTNQMWKEKYINTMKTTRTQLVPALNKNVYPATKPIVWGLNKPAVFLFNFIVCASMCVSGFVCSVMACSDEMTFCTNSQTFPAGDGDNTHTSARSKRPICMRSHTLAHKHEAWLWTSLSEGEMRYYFCSLRQ